MPCASWRRARTPRSVSSDSPTQDEVADCLLILSASTFEKLIAFQRMLSTARLTAADDYDSVIELVQSHFDRVIAATRWSLLLNAYRSLRAGQSQIPLVALANGLTALKVIVTRANRLAQYMGILPRQAVDAGLVTALRRAYPSRWGHLRPAVVLLPRLVSQEFDLGSKLANDRILDLPKLEQVDGRPVIQLAGVDSASPLSLGTLAHEFGHAIANEDDLESHLGAGFSDLSEEHQRASHELFADVVGTAGLGPGTLLALIRDEAFLLADHKKHFPGTRKHHPALLARIEFVSEYFGPDLLAPYSRTLALFKTAVRVLLGLQPDNLVKAEQVISTKVIPDAKARVGLALEHIALPSIDAAQLSDRSERLADRMRRMMPPAAIRWLGKEQVRDQVERARPDADRQAEILDLLREAPASPSEVIAAAFRRRDDEWYDLIDRVLRESDLALSFADMVEPATAFLEAESMLTRAGLVASEVHSTLLEAAEELRQAPSVANEVPEATAEEGERDESIGGVLSDAQIASLLLAEREEDRLYVTPLIDPKRQIGPASLDIRLGSEVLVMTNADLDRLDPTDDECATHLAKQAMRRSISHTSPLVLHPGEFALASSLEYVCLPPNLAARLEGRSSLGRAGVLIHATAGFIDPGYRGFITLELSNAGKTPIRLYPGIRVGQLSFFGCHGTLQPYDVRKTSKYSHAHDVLHSRIYQDEEYKWLKKLHGQGPGSPE